MEEEAMKGAVTRFRVMALLAGVMSLLLWFVDLPVKYLLNDPSLDTQHRQLGSLLLGFRLCAIGSCLHEVIERIRPRGGGHGLAIEDGGRVAGTAGSRTRGLCA